jgi:hypothetical protein
VTVEAVAVGVGVVAEHARARDGQRRVLVGGVASLTGVGASLTQVTVRETVAVSVPPWPSLIGVGEGVGPQ